MQQKARCVHCRTDVVVPDSYADGDHIKCGACGTQHRVIRSTGATRLVIADVAPLREALRDHEARIENLERELAVARGSLGLGANGLGIGVIYLVAKIGWHEATLDRALVINAVVIGLAAGFFLELCNYLFLSKRKAINSLTRELTQMTDEAKELQRKIREASIRR